MKLLAYPEDRNDIVRVTSRLDYSAALVPDATRSMVIKACDEAKRYGFAAVPVFSTWIPLVSRSLAGTAVNPQLTVGFPSGAVSPEVKLAETRFGLENGAREIDMVLNVGKLVEGEADFISDEIQGVVATAREYGVAVKVIIESGYLNDLQKKQAVELIHRAGAAYVKTCTGFGPGKATVHDILLLQEAAAGRIKVKASGGVLTLEDGLEFILCGADRVAGRYNIVEQLLGLGIEGL